MPNPRNTPARQLSLFGDDEQAQPIEPTTIIEPEPTPSADAEAIDPLPLRIASEYNFGLQHHEVDGVGYYSITDWLAGVSGNADGRQATKQWTEIQRRLKKAEIQLSTRVGQLPYRASNNKTYQRDFATDVGLYQITQRMAADTGLRNKILELMAVSLKTQDDEFINPDLKIQRGLDAKAQRKYTELVRGGMTHDEAMQWISVRGKQPVKTVTLRDTWKARGITNGQFGTLTNVVTQVATGRTATEHKRMPKVNNSREGLSAYENAVITVVETVSDILHNARDSHGIDELTADIQDSDGVVNRDELAKQMSKKRPRLTDGSK